MTSSVTQNVGNVTKDVDITFEYGVRPHHSKAFILAEMILRSLYSVGLMNEQLVKVEYFLIAFEP